MGKDADPSVLLEALQGEWKASRGEVIVVQGKDLMINGSPLPGGLKLTPDGQRAFGYGIYKINPEGKEDGKIFWIAGYQEIIWQRATAAEVQSTIERMDASIANQGEGLAAAANSGGGDDFGFTEQALVVQLNELIEQWREGPLVRVRSCDICPDWTNRAQTGLSVDHVHYVATNIATWGFKSRRRGCSPEEGAHDVPVLVRESVDTELGLGALEKWREHTTENHAFPPFLLDGQKHFFCSLGNGHFSQALNLFRTKSHGLYTDRPYEVGNDEALREALEEGVDSVVLSNAMPVSERKFVSEMLNRAHGRQWNVGADGQISISGDIPTAPGSQFLALSKVLDAEELGCLVRTKLGVDADRQGLNARPKSNFVKSRL